MPTLSKKVVAGGRLFPEAEYDADSSFLLQILSVIILPSYFIGFTLYILLFGILIGDAASQLWLQGIVVSLFMDILVLQPFKIWVKWIAASSICNAEVRGLLGLLRERCHHIMSRVRGSITESSALIQHLNPACRVARKYPQYPISRYLMSLNDYDLPVNYAYKTRTRLQMIEFVIGSLLLSILFIWSVFPEYIQETINEALLTPALMGLIAFAWYLDSLRVGWVALLILCIFVLVIVIREVYCYKRRSQLKPPLAPCAIALDDNVPLKSLREFANSALVEIELKSRSNIRRRAATGRKKLVEDDSAALQEWQRLKPNQEVKGTIFGQIKSVKVFAHNIDDDDLIPVRKFSDADIVDAYQVNDSLARFNPTAHRDSQELFIQEVSDSDLI